MAESCRIVKTELPPCAISRYTNRFIVGTYDLHKDTGKRSGSLDIYDDDLNLFNQHYTESAVLDTKIYDSKLYTACSTGEVRIYDLSNEPSEIKAISIGEESELVTQIYVTNNKLNAVLTSGELVVYDLVKECETYRAKNHELEAWTVNPALNSNQIDDNIIFTGGDDRALTCTDLRIPYMLWSVKPHDAGVTSILPKSSGNILWTGGYDDCLNFFDLRSRRVSESHNLGGGVWRLIPNSVDSKVLACCMYGGLRILDSSNADVNGSLENHESMVYGGSWLDDSSGVTCSFYDNMLQKWKVV